MTGLRRILLLRFGLWFTGFVVVVIFAIANLGTDLSLASFSTPDSSPAGSPVDQQIYFASRHLAELAATPQEQHFAVMAMRAADHELDQSFATAIRQSSSSNRSLPAAAVSTAKRMAALRLRVKQDQSQIDELSKRQDSATADADAEQLRIAQAQSTLDNDELDNLEDDFARLGGNRSGEIQQAFDQHRAMESQAAALPQNTATAALESQKNLHTLVGKARILHSLRERRKLLGSEQAEIARTTGLLLKEEADLESTPADATARTQQAPDSRAGATVQKLEALSGRQRDITDVERRIHDLGQLQTSYQDWQALLGLQVHTIRIAIVADVLTIMMAFLAIFAIGALAQGLLKKLETRYQRRLDHIGVLVSFTLELAVVARAAVVLFGVPGDVSTIVGLVTAGITIALRDFLVSFVGWFLLMGKRGVQVGDWVEIDSTQGEVVKITMLHTYLLETGNWATDGHATGRQAVFLNKFAVERKYLNFSTPGQWLWDELAIPIPAAKEVTPQMLSAIAEMVEKETQGDATQAEAAWFKIVQAHQLAERTATPFAVLCTTAAGLEVRVRYVTKASTRFDAAVRLRRQVLKMLAFGKQEMSA